ncbi:UDP-glucose 4-epimerase GalE [Microgenomates group bacterium RBG_16_45_19]|nr:MAG: UDP-glucose 4-epimerase GalE [Microgenomates group bacterium RBG_16_45_19]
MKILVTGGAGYIGSVTTDHLLQAGHEVVVLDNLSHGYREMVPQGAELVEGDIHDKALLREILGRGFEAVMHFAALIEAGESMADPIKYFDNNVVGSETLLAEIVRAKIKQFIFSSTAAVYQSKDEPLREADPLKPANVYGQTKLMIEEMLGWLNQTKGLRVGIFRYFNAAGASLLETPPKRGEAHIPETHIIPNILAVALGQQPEFKLYGNDYPTPDGSCIRDYIHIDDLAEAHVLGLEALKQNQFEFEVFNLGNGQGFSNQEVLAAAREVTGRDIAVTIQGRREGDAVRLVAASDKAKTVLGWTPKHPELKEIIASAWAWHQVKDKHETGKPE